MYSRVKYIVTEENDIIVFNEILNHSDFRKFNPVRAGFISFGVNKQGNPTCSCYGESISLGLKSDPVKDTLIAKLKLNMLDEY